MNALGSRDIQLSFCATSGVEIIGVARVNQQPSATTHSAAAAAEPPACTPQPTPAAAPQAPAAGGAASPEAERAVGVITPPDDTEGKQDKKDKKKDKKKKKEARVRGVETMFRVTYNNHVSLSQLADNKANILISLNGAIISALIVILTPRLGSITWTFAPVAVLVIGCTVSLAFAILGSRPRLSRTPVTVEQVRDNTGNALFFGQFTSMTLEQFQESMRLLTNDDKLVYDALSRQLYSMGRSLLRKYRYLQIAYSAFFAAFALAAGSYIAIMIAFGGGA
jgi:hypothetical protein